MKKNFLKFQQTLISSVATAATLLTFGEAHAGTGRMMNSTTGEGIEVGVDYSTLAELNYRGQEIRYIADGRGGWSYYNDNVWLFDAVWEDGHTTEFRAHSEFLYAEAADHAETFAMGIGRLPKFARHDFDFIMINPGNGFGGGGGRAMTFSLNNTAPTLSNFGYSFEELSLHEAAHSNLWGANYNTPGWIAAQEADDAFYSGYARDNAIREDISESVVAWVGVRHRPERLPQRTLDFANSTIPSRLAYFDQLDLDPYPLNRPIAAPFLDDTSSQVLYQPSEGAWSSRAFSGSFTNYSSRSATVGASASFKFTGAKVTLYGLKRDDLGIADVYMDGEYLGSVDFYSSQEQPFQPLYESPVLANGDHTLTVVVTGDHNPEATATDGEIIIDAFQYEVRNPNDTTPPARPAGLTATEGFGRVRLNWANNTEADLYGYNVYRYDESGFRVLVGPCLEKSYFLDDEVPANRTWNYEVTALDTRGNESAARAISATVSGVAIYIDDESSSITYDGNWNTYPEPVCYLGTEHYSRDEGATATFTFTGRQAKILGLTRPDLGKANIYLDGNFVATVDCYSNPRKAQQVLYETPILASGNHTLTVEVAGTSNPAATTTNGTIILDAFVVQGQVPFSTQAITPFLQTNGGSWQETGTINVNVGDNVNFGPWPYWGSGTWSWTGPQRFRHESRTPVLQNIKLEQAGEYVATYINEQGQSEGSYAFTVNVSNPYPETPITPYVKVNNQGWKAAETVILNVGDNLYFGPQPNYSAQNVWNWTGPNGFTYSDRSPVISDIQLQDAGYYEVTYTNRFGTVSEFTYLIHVKDPLEGDSFFTQSYTGYRNNYEGWLGYEFTPAVNLDVEALGRPVGDGMLQQHSLKIWRVSNQSEITGIVVKPSSPIDANGYAYEKLSSPVTLSAGVTYRIASWERNGGDKWRNAGNISGHSDAATISKGTYGNNFYSYPPSVYWGSENGYVAPNFYFTE